MKIKIERSQLLQGIQTVQGTAQDRTTLPIISNALLEADGKLLRLTTTDLDVTTTCSVEAEVKEPGQTTLPMRKLVAIAKEMASEAIEIEVDSKQVAELVCGRSRYHVNGLPASDFPPTPRLKSAKTFTIGRDALKQAIGRTSFAQSQEASRFVLNGILFVESNDSMVLVASDGRRLVVASEDFSSKGKNAGEFILPTKAVNELTRLVGSGEGTVTCSYNDQYASFEIESEGESQKQIISKQIEGVFPNYKQIIPAKFKEKVTMARAELLAALRRVDIMTTEKAASVKMEFKRNLLTVSTNSTEIGDASEEVDIKYGGAEAVVAFNPKYLIEALSALTEEVVFFEFIDELSPAAIKINGPFICVVSPMRAA